MYVIMWQGVLNAPRFSQTKVGMFKNYNAAPLYLTHVRKTPPAVRCYYKTNTVVKQVDLIGYKSNQASASSQLCSLVSNKIDCGFAYILILMV